MPDDVESNDLSQIGLSEEANSRLEKMCTEGIFKEKRDGYRLAIALAIINDLEPTAQIKRHKNIAHAHAVDPEGDLIGFVRLRRPELQAPPYRLLQGLADAGVNFIYHELQNGRDPIAQIASG